MSTSQSGIFALGTASHAYLEFDGRRPGATRELATAVASLREPRTTMGGVNLVAGFRPELWRELVPDDAPAGIEGFNRDIVGPDGYTMPATQHDAVLWLSGSAYDVVFDMAREAIAALDAVASVAQEPSSWPYRHDRDLTGFIDGTENPDLIDAPETFSRIAVKSGRSISNTAREPTALKSSSAKALVFERLPARLVPDSSSRAESLSSQPSCWASAARIDSSALLPKAEASGLSITSRCA